MPDMDTYSGPQMGGPDPDQLLTRKEAAALLGYSVSTVKRWEREGILTAHRAETNAKTQARPRYRRGDLLAVIKRDAA